MTLQIEYRCTDAEMKEAQMLASYQIIGRGSKWRTTFLLYGLLAVTLGGAYLKFTREMTAGERPWYVGIAVVAFIGLLALKRLTREKAQPLVRLEVSEREVVFTSDNGRNARLWSGFSHCIESPTLFVLLDRPKTILFAVPKRAFPDEAAQRWFRATANQPQSVAATASDETLIPGRFVAGGGVGLTLQLKYRDYLDRLLASWRTKGMLIFILTLIIGMIIFSPTPPDAVNSKLKTSLIMLPMMAAIMAVMIPLIAFLSWRGERKYLTPQHIVLTSNGIEFVSQDAGGRQAWSAYKFYLEGRWSFFVWNPRGSAWFMFPKRAFGSASDLAQCRALLQANLKRSRWFYL